MEEEGGQAAGEGRGQGRNEQAAAISEGLMKSARKHTLNISFIGALKIAFFLLASYSPSRIYFISQILTIEVCLEKSHYLTLMVP